MMKTYALLSNNEVVEIIPPMLYDAEDPNWSPGEPSRIGSEIPIELRYHPDFVAAMVEITVLDPMPNQRWTYDGVTFSPPYVHVPTDEEIAAGFDAYRKQLMKQASLAMTPLLVSLNLGDATDAETLKAKEWQAYYRALDSLAITPEEPVWPVAPE